MKKVTYSQGPGDSVAGAPASLVIRVRAGPMAGRHGPNSMSLPVLAQIGEARLTLQTGDNPVPLPPGVWPVTVWCSYYGMKSGRADITVDTRSGRPTLLYYTAPRTIYNAGVLGYEPAEPPGRSTLLAIYTLAPVTVIVAVIIAAVIAR